MDLGRTDSPMAALDSDRLETARYANALARFIQDCETPLTIGIQGEWGSGKTSLMRMVERGLKSHDGPLLINWFDTWQYGAIGDDELLGIQLLKDLTITIGAVLHADAEAMRTAHKILGWITTATSMAKRGAELVGRAAAAGTTNYLTGGILDGGTFAAGLGGGEEPERIQLATLREGFDRLVKHYVIAKNGDPKARVVVFIDDLDRIRPGRAVALLEVLKNFAEVERCVFVIACDKEVVNEGVQERLGITDPRKKEAFFEKIFQVPFQMPVGTYSNVNFLTDYVNRLLETRARDSSKPKQRQDRAARIAAKINSAITSAIGTNPRALKRFFNIADLLHCVEENQGATVADCLDETGPSLFLLLVAMHTRWPAVALYLAEINSPDRFQKALKTLQNTAESDDEVDEELEGLLQGQYGREVGENWRATKDVEDLKCFARELEQLLDKSHDGIDQAEFNQIQTWFKRLRFSASNASPSFKTGYFKFMHSAVTLSDTNGDAFVGLVQALENRFARDRRFDIYRSEDQYQVSIRNGVGQNFFPMNFFIRSEPASRQLLVRFNLGDARVSKAGIPSLKSVGLRFIQATRGLGVAWTVWGQGLRVDFLSERVPQDTMNEFRQAILDLHEACAQAVEQELKARAEALTSMSTTTLTPGEVSSGPSKLEETSIDCQEGSIPRSIEQP